ncbi:glycoprotein 3-alpha-L-fucosyltransferase A-like [Mercenaria mercenaria]|uniref:glycoprotein 3-alpha-L-fucosyltransferase A-like n=1 Tax=Mercenaria mercenaria TaxID=6596 RepID=UPI00234F5FCA|nr:glycoprotein 3-alpha-L-fucosyltransferase A-like [Mercenaria mercenaria]
MANKYLKILFLCVLTLVILIESELLIQKFGIDFCLNAKEETTLSSAYINESSATQMEKGVKYFRITWYDVPKFWKYRPDAAYSGFKGCNYNNCKLSFNNSDAEYSDAIIFQGGYMFPLKLRFKRPNGQIWIFFDLEPPYRYNKQRYSSVPKNSFNWTMTYDKSVSDIHLPYGEITKKSYTENRSKNAILRSKNKTALIIMSHCNTPADRLRYVNALRKIIDVDILGACGTKWSCGIRSLHNHCFEILNRYKFFLAFENSFCNNYFTEKVFDNFDYDVVLVTRGGKKSQIKEILPDGTYLSTDDFKNARELGLYLKSMTDKTYLNMIRRKQKFTSSRSYISVFHKAMCEICRKLNNAHMFTNTIIDIDKWAFSSNPCRSPDDFE